MYTRYMSIPQALFHYLQILWQFIYFLFLVCPCWQSPMLQLGVSLKHKTNRSFCWVQWVLGKRCSRSPKFCGASCLLDLCIGATMTRPTASLRVWATCPSLKRPGRRYSETLWPLPLHHNNWLLYFKTVKRITENYWEEEIHCQIKRETIVA